MDPSAAGVCYVAYILLRCYTGKVFNETRSSPRGRHANNGPVVREDIYHSLRTQSQGSSSPSSFEDPRLKRTIALGLIFTIRLRTVYGSAQVRGPNVYYRFLPLSRSYRDRGPSGLFRFPCAALLFLKLNFLFVQFNFFLLRIHVETETVITLARARNLALAANKAELYVFADEEEEEEESADFDLRAA